MACKPSNVYSADTWCSWYMCTDIINALYALPMHCLVVMEIIAAPISYSHNRIMTLPIEAKNGTRMTRIEQISADLIRINLFNPRHPRAILLHDVNHSYKNKRAIL
jgi:hypothetical protein